MMLPSLFALTGGLSVLTLVVSADDHLVSSRFTPAVGRPIKRGYQEDGTYNVTFLHVNDVHAHLDSFRSTGVDCPANNTANNIPCYGGYARLLNKIEEVRGSVNDSLTLNAGDEWQGTLFYRYYGGEKIAGAINQVGFDAFTLGNHEFDANDTALATFLSNLTFPTVATNVRSTYQPLSEQLMPYVLFPQHELAIVGLTTTDVPNISQPGNGTTFEPLVESVQPVVDGLLDGSIGGGNGTVKRVVALTHIGYEEDIKLAQSTRNIHLIIGGHSHTKLTQVGGDDATSQGDYPTIVRNLDNEEVFIVTAWRWGQYLGRLDVAFAPDSGKIMATTGAPIVISENVTQDADLQAQVEEWRVPFDEFGKQVIGSTNTVLDQDTCYQGECTLGDAVTDAMVAARRAEGTNVTAAIHNAGGIRATISGPKITQSDVLTSFPFGNSLVDIQLTGAQLWDVVEGTVSGVNSANVTTRPIQVSKELQFTFNPNATIGSRLIELKVGNPLQELVWDQNYTITTLDFIATGGDGIIPNASKTSPPPLQSQDETFAAFVRENSPLNYTVEGRILKTNETVQRKPNGGSNGTSAAAVGAGGNSTVAALSGSHPRLFGKLELTKLGATAFVFSLVGAAL